MTRPTYSLHHRLLGILLLATVGVWLLIGIGGYQLAHHEADELFDSQLETLGHNLLAVVASSDDDGVAQQLGQRSPDSQEKLQYAVWRIDRHAQLLMASADNDPDLLQLPLQEGFADQVWPSGRWRSFSSADNERRFFVRIAENEEVREELAREYASRLLLPLLAGLPLLALLMAWLLRVALRPVQQVASSIEARQPDEQTPLQLPAEVPREIAPLLDALDRLFGRVGQAIERERNFTANAAHELRTPLAAIRLHAQVARHAVGTDGSVSDGLAAIDEVLDAADRTTHLVEQLLTLARLTPEEVRSGESCDLVAQVRAVSSDLAPAAHAKGQQLAYDGVDQALLSGRAALLYTLVRNLLDNAIRYTPAGGQISLSVHAEGAGWRLEVVDDGPGIAAARRAEALSRFARLDRHDVQGCGLGLSIVATIAELHGARLELAERDGASARPGLRVRVIFPKSM
jgi:two-component system sensor histidine kinase QseC